MKYTTSYATQRRRSFMLEFALFILAVTALTAASAAMYYGRDIGMREVSVHNGAVTKYPASRLDKWGYDVQVSIGKAMS